MKTLNQTIVLGLLSLVLVSGCKKSFLDAKPSTSIVAPSTLEDLQLLLENSDVLNSCTPGLPLMGGDEYIYLDYQNWQSAPTATERNSYIWAKDIFEGQTNIRDWSRGYTGIFYCNNVLEILNGIDKSKSDINQYNTLKGWALFARAYILHDLVINFSPAYDEATSSADLGVPVRVKAGIDEILPRSSIKDTYSQILSDLNEAEGLLDPAMPGNRNRPSKPAVYALYSRMYLNMRKYDLAEVYADSTLLLYNKLIDYNTISKTSTNPFPVNGDETIFNTAVVVSAYTIIAPFSANTRITVNPDLMKLYDPNDLRLSILFKTNMTTGNLYFNRSYFPHIRPFSGLATDEIYLIKAECLARRGQIISAMNILNTLLKARFPPANYRELTAFDQTDALNKVLLERRKELVWRALRWSDLKRLNKEGANITLTRMVNGTIYTLPPNDPRYVFPIPDDEIALSKIQQNLR